MTTETPGALVPTNPNFCVRFPIFSEPGLDTFLLEGEKIYSFRISVSFWDPELNLNMIFVNPYHIFPTERGFAAKMTSRVTQQFGNPA